MFGTVAGDHWRIAPGAQDPKLPPESAAIIGHVVEQRLHFTFNTNYNYLPESAIWPGVSIACLFKTNGIGETDVVLQVDRTEREIYLESRYLEWRWSGNPPYETNIEQAISGQVLAILKELYPHSTATPFIRYEEWWGP